MNAIKLPITGLAAASLALLLFFLSIRVIQGRLQFLVALGDGGEKLLRKRIRAHANFTEYVPLTLILLALAELARLHHNTLIFAAISLVAGRAIHAFGVSQPREQLWFRRIGLLLNFTSLLTLSGLLIISNI